MPHRYDHRDESSPPAPRERDRLVVIGFNDESLAFGLRDVLCELEEESVIEVGDAVVVTRNANGKVRLHQSIPLISGRAALGAFGGLLMGMLLLNPLFGVVAGAAAGAAAGALGDVGIDDAFMKSLGETLIPGSSALFVIVRNTKPEQLLERLQPFAGRCKVLQSTMSPENETILRNLLEGALHQAQSTESKP
jgi:uncharacterized membrane protein